MWRVGIQFFTSTKYHEYTLVIELYNKDLLTYNKTDISVTGTGMAIESHNTQKDRYQYQRGKFLYYTKTLIHFKKTINNPPVFIYYTIHYEKQGSDLDKYPNVFKDNVYLVAYGVDGISDHVDSDVYDSHKAFELEKTQVKYFLPINMNNKKIANVLLDTNDNSSVPNMQYVKNLSIYTSNHVYREICEHFYDSRETSSLNLVGRVSGVVIHKINPNLFLEKDRYINDYNSKFGLKFSTKSYILTDQITQDSNYAIFISFIHDKIKV